MFFALAIELVSSTLRCATPLSKRLAQCSPFPFYSLPCNVESQHVLLGFGEILGVEWRLYGDHMGSRSFGPPASKHESQKSIFTVSYYWKGLKKLSGFTKVLIEIGIQVCHHNLIENSTRKLFSTKTKGMPDR